MTEFRENLNGNRAAQERAPTTDPASPPPHQGAECVTVKPSPSTKQRRLDCTHTHTPPRKGCPSWGLAIRPQSQLKQQKHSRATGTGAKVREAPSPPRSNSLSFLKVLILQRFSKIGISWTEKPTALMTGLKGPGICPKAAASDRMAFMLVGRLSSSPLTWRQDQVFMIFFILLSNICKKGSPRFGTVK